MTITMDLVTAIREEARHSVDEQAKLFLDCAARIVELERQVALLLPVVRRTYECISGCITCQATARNALAALTSETAPAPDSAGPRA